MSDNIQDRIKQSAESLERLCVELAAKFEARLCRADGMAVLRAWPGYGDKWMVRFEKDGMYCEMMLPWDDSTDWRDIVTKALQALRIRTQGRQA